jgi:hypothetical protein
MNGWTLLPPIGPTSYGTGSVVTYVSGSSTSLSTISAVSYTSFTSYSIVGIPEATPILGGVVSGAQREVQRGWSLGAAIVGAAGAGLAMF